MEKVKDWLRIGRVQTFPASWLLVLVPFLNGRTDLVQVFILTIFMWFIHFASFGHNSLMDTAMGYDLKDSSKSHHPLVSGRITLTVAHNVVHWSLCGLALFAILLSLMFSPNPLYAVIAVFLWWVFGFAYNSGLSKESLLSFLPISICFTAMGAWGWFLSHNSLSRLGWLLLAYFFMTILFQISWSGHLKEMGLKERSNILVKMGAKVENGRFIPRYSMIYGGVIKFINIPILGGLLLWMNFDFTRLIWLVVVTLGTSHILFKLIKPRQYIREKELQNMGMMEIFTIYLPIPLVLDWLPAIFLMVVGVIYYFSLNKILWGASYPKV